MATLIKTNGEEIKVQPGNGSDFSLKELQELVNGYIQVLQINDKTYMVVDEEGKIKNKPLNEKATKMVREILLTVDYIVGDVLICDDSEIK